MLFRKADLPSLAPYLSNQFHQSTNTTLTPPPTSTLLQSVQESGPLASLAPLLDVGSRRVLPGHLSRRSQALGIFRSEDTFYQRCFVTACTGEQATLLWKLEYRSSSSENEDGRWCIASITTRQNYEEEEYNNDDNSVSTPHPRYSPELVITSQLAALRHNNIFQAASFNCWGAARLLSSKSSDNHDSGGGTEGVGFGIHYKLMLEMIENGNYKALINHDTARLLDAVLPTQRHMVQHVQLSNSSNRSSCSNNKECQDFIWKMAMVDNGCWMVTAIERI